MMLVSQAAMAPKLQHVPQGFWDFTGVTTPSSRKSYVLGNALFASAATLSAPLS